MQIKCKFYEGMLLIWAQGGFSKFTYGNYRLVKKNNPPDTFHIRGIGFY